MVMKTSWVWLVLARVALFLWSVLIIFIAWFLEVLTCDKATVSNSSVTDALGDQRSKSYAWLKTAQIFHDNCTTVNSHSGMRLFQTTLHPDSVWFGNSLLLIQIDNWKSPTLLCQGTTLTLFIITKTTHAFTFIIIVWRSASWQYRRRQSYF